MWKKKHVRTVSKSCCADELDSRDLTNLTRNFVAVQPRRSIRIWIGRKRPGQQAQWLSRKDFRFVSLALGQRRRSRERKTGCFGCFVNRTSDGFSVFQPDVRCVG